jgi:general secretion pathway protein M
MATNVLDRLNLNPRERRLVMILMGVAVFMVLVGIPLGLNALVRARRADNDDLRAAIENVHGARAQVRERQARKVLTQQRYQLRAPVLAGYLEQSARAEKLEVSDSTDRPEVPHGKRYIERNTVIHLKKAGMLAISEFMESLEKGGMPLAVTRLNIRKRTGEVDSFDVELGASAFDRNEASAESAEKKAP